MSDNKLYFCCSNCDELVKIPSPVKKGRYKCPNCSHYIYSYHPDMFEKVFALNFAALILFFVTNYFPFLTFNVLGNSSQANFTTSIIYLYNEDQYLMAAAIFFTTLFIPLIRIVTFIVLCGSLYLGFYPKNTPSMLKVIEKILPWGMIDVFLIGVLVSIVKLVKMGDIIPGISMYTFGAMILILAYAQLIFHPHEVWRVVDLENKKAGFEGN